MHADALPVVRAPESAVAAVVPTGPQTAKQLRFALTDAAGFSKMPKPRAGDWLASFKEPGQSFAEYLRSRPVRARPGQDVLAFQPVGGFCETQRAVVQATIEFAGVWFDLKTRTLEALPLPGADWSRQRSFSWVDEPVTQYLTDWFLDNALPPQRPDDAVCLVGVTAGDLYPEPGWNYVFGQASLHRRVGIYSVARFFAKFWGREETPATRLQALRRSFKLVVHETGHTFGVEHCIEYECTMNGSNSLEESDRGPLHLCPPCLRKLHVNRGFDVLERYRGLLALYRKHGLEHEARWTLERMQRIATVP